MVGSGRLSAPAHRLQRPRYTYSTCGPQAELALAEDFDQIRSAMEKVPPYSAIFTKVRQRPLHSR